MKKPNSKVMKILIPMVVVFAAIYIAKSGYAAGQWLYDVVHVSVDVKKVK